MEMNLIITDAKIHDLVSFHTLTTEPDIMVEFQNFFQLVAISDKKKYLECWIDQNENSQKGNFLRLIKLAAQDGLEQYNYNNSILIGFMYNSLAGMSDAMQIGTMNINLLNFALDARFRNNGIMTNSILLTIKYMEEREYGYAAAFTRHNNIPSRKILEKTGFVKSKDGDAGSLFVRKLSWDDDDFRNAFNV